VTKSEISKLLGMIGAAFPAMRPATEEMVEVWHSLIGDIPVNIAIEAVKRCLIKSRFVPTIAEIREAYATVAFPELLSADEALAEVNAAINRHGNSAEVCKSVSPLSAHVVRQIGLWDMCFSDNTAAINADFRRLYTTLAEKEKNARLQPGYKAHALLTKGTEQTED